MHLKQKKKKKKPEKEHPHKKTPTPWILSFWELCQASWLYNRAIYFWELDFRGL